MGKGHILHSWTAASETGYFYHTQGRYLNMTLHNEFSWTSRPLILFTFVIHSNNKTGIYVFAYQALVVN